MTGLAQPDQPLPRPDAIKLLLSIAPRIEPHANEIAALCGDAPLALRLAASALAVRPTLSPDDYAAKLRDEQGRMKSLEPVRAALAVSYDLLPATLQTLWQVLTLFVGGFNHFTVSQVMHLDKEITGKALNALVKFSIVEYDRAAQRYHLHDLARRAAGERWQGAERRLMEYQHARYFMHVLSTANDLYHAGGDKASKGLNLYNHEWANIEAGQAWAAAHAEENDDAAVLCCAYATAGWALRNVRQVPHDDIIWTEAALKAARRLKYQEIEAACLRILGSAYADLGETRRAIEYHEQELIVDREIGDQSAAASALGNLGLAYAALGETRRAIELFEQHLAIAREMGDRRGEGVDLGNLGLAYAALGETRRAIEFHEQALIIDREIGDRPGEGATLFNMSLALDRLGQRSDAIASAEAALRIYEQIEDPNAEQVRQALAEWKGSAADLDGDETD